MDTLNKEFWEKRDAAMKRFMASKERKRKRMAELEQMLRQDYLARTGEEPKFVNVCDMKQLSLKTINASSPYDVMMVNPNTYR